MSLLEAAQITVRYGARNVLDDVSLTVAPGEFVGLVGPNGAGKTTLLRVLAGLAAPAEGFVLLDGGPAPAPRAAARTLAYLPYGAPCYWPLPVRRVVALGRLPHLGPWRRPGPADHAAIESALEQAGVAGLAARSLPTLSSGERMRVMVARALAQEPRILLADEPTAALDPYHQLRVLDLLQARAARGSAVLAVLHDLPLAARYCSRLLLLVEGRVVGEGAPDEVLTRERVRDAYGVEVVADRFGARTFHLPAAGPSSVTAEA